MNFYLMETWIVALNLYEDSIEFFNIVSFYDAL
jgi:hypothetical protein